MATAPSRRFTSHIKAKNFNTKPRTLTAATTLTEADAGGTFFLSLTAGFQVTLPAASGTGNRYKFIVKTASNAYKIASTTGAGFFVGAILINDVGDSSAATVDAYAGNGTTHDFINPTTAGGGGLAGDWIEVIDIDTDKWAVSGVFQSATDPVTPFATS